MVGLFRYLTHLDNADKHSISKDEVVYSSEGEYQMFVNQMDFFDLDISFAIEYHKIIKISYRRFTKLSVLEMPQNIGGLLKDLFPLNRKEII